MTFGKPNERFVVDARTVVHDTVGNPRKMVADWGWSFKEALDHVEFEKSILGMANVRIKITDTNPPISQKAIESPLFDPNDDRATRIAWRKILDFKEYVIAAREKKTAGEGSP